VGKLWNVLWSEILFCQKNSLTNVKMFNIDKFCRCFEGGCSDLLEAILVLVLHIVLFLEVGELGDNLLVKI
jgi:hypothetical protein